MLASSRSFPKPSVILLAAAALFLGSLILVSSLSASWPREWCRDGSYCGLSRFRDRLGDFSSRMRGHRPAPAANCTDSPKKAACANFPDTSRVLLIMKTGASEAYKKVPSQLATTLSCLGGDFLIFSDMGQKMFELEIIDSLQDVSSAVKKMEDFELYFRQKECLVDQDSCNDGWDAAGEAWRLDKYKNVHMAVKAYALKPDYDWYLFVDADTYVSWPTLMQWLQHMSPKRERYLGSVVYLGDNPFGHGGSGYLVSQASMRKLLKDRSWKTSKYDLEASKTCCGDLVFSLAMKWEAGVSVEQAWPTINGEKPFTMPFEDNQWCQPIVTMHHAGAEEVAQLYDFERTRNFSSPLRIKELYYQFVQGRLEDSRDEWDNLSDDTKFKADVPEGEVKLLSDVDRVAHESFENCQKACENQDKCVQFRYHAKEKECGLGHKIRHGHPSKKNKDDSRWRSGWRMEKIENWVKEKQKCDELKFPALDS